MSADPVARTSASDTSTAAGDRAVCLLGVEPAGGSLSSRLVRSLGIDIAAQADALVNGEARRHPLVEINDAVLGAFAENQSSSPPALPRGFELDPRLRTSRERAQQAIAARGGRWGWRDPRLALTLPFWRGLLPRPVYVLSIGNPSKVVSSCLDRNLDRGPEQIAALWLRLNAGALAATRGEPRVLFLDGDTREDLLRERARIAELLGTGPAPNGEDPLDAVAQEPEGSLSDVARDERLPVEVRAFHLGLHAAVSSAREASRDGRDDGLAHATRTLPGLWKALEDRLLLAAAEDERLTGAFLPATGARPGPREVERLQAEVDHLRQELDLHRQFLSSMKSSLSWRLTSPLRKLKARLSSRRG